MLSAAIPNLLVSPVLRNAAWGLPRNRNNIGIALLRTTQIRSSSTPSARRVFGRPCFVQSTASEVPVVRQACTPAFQPLPFIAKVPTTSAQNRQCRHFRRIRGSEISQLSHIGEPDKGSHAFVSLQVRNQQREDEVKNIKQRKKAQESRGQEQEDVGLPLGVSFFVFYLIWTASQADNGRLASTYPKLGNAEAHHDHCDCHCHRHSDHS
jgi:hypothetical protein